MSLTKTDEQYVLDLFRKKLQYEKNSDSYYEIRNDIAKYLLTQLGSDIKSCIRHWKSKYKIDESDGESLIYENLLHAIDSYQVDRGKCKFSSFFWTVNSCLFKNYLAKIYAQKRSPQVLDSDLEKSFQPIYSMSHEVFQNNETITLEDMIEDPYSMEDRLHNRILLEKLYKLLSSKQRKVLKRLFYGKTYNEIGKRLNMTPSDICSLLKRIRRKYEKWYKQ